MDNFQAYKDTLDNGYKYPLSNTIKITQNGTFTTQNYEPYIVFSNKNINDLSRFILSKYPKLKILIHNFANNFAPCDNKFGGNTQEEQLFRQTNLGLTLLDIPKLYPICLINPETKIASEINILYTPMISIFKDSNNNYLDKVNTVGVVTSAASAYPRSISIDYDIHKDDYYYPAEKKTMLDKIHLMLSTAEKNKYDVFITGAWGCGAFCNPTYGLAKLWRAAIRQHNVPCVIFAIPDKDLCEKFKKIIV